MNNFLCFSFCVVNPLSKAGVVIVGWKAGRNNDVDNTKLRININEVGGNLIPVIFTIILDVIW